MRQHFSHTHIIVTSHSGSLAAATNCDDEPQSAAAVVVSENFWAKTLGVDSQIIGKALTLSGNSYVVIGVLARDPGFFLRPVDYYLPLRPTAAQHEKEQASAWFLG